MVRATAVISGISGQDGQYLTKFLSQKGYRVVGVARSSTTRWQSCLEIEEPPELLAASVTDTASLIGLLKEVRPSEVYNLSAISFVPDSWQQPVESARISGISVVCWLEAIRHVDPKIRFFNASTAALYGGTPTLPINEGTGLNPKSPYATAKALGHLMTVNFRESYGLFCCNGILFNHESPLRPPSFVTRRITQAVAEIRAGKRKQLRLANLGSLRDWGFAGDFVRAFWLMLQQEFPEDYVLSTGSTCSVEDFAAYAFSLAGLDWQQYVTTHAETRRPAESLSSDPTKARMKLGWVAETDWQSLVRMMLESDFAQFGLSLD